MNLLPCPFCGGEPIMQFQLDDLGDWKVQCDNCGASTCPEGTHYTKEKAEEDWNIRRTA